MLHRALATPAVIALAAMVDASLPIGFYMNYAMHPIDFYLTV
jgi:hypothetical protein